MAQLIHEPPTAVLDEEGRTYLVRVWGAERSDGTWEAWLEFDPRDGGPDLLRTERGNVPAKPWGRRLLGPRTRADLPRRGVRPRARPAAVAATRPPIRAAGRGRRATWRRPRRSPAGMYYNRPADRRPRSRCRSAWTSAGRSPTSWPSTATAGSRSPRCRRRRRTCCRASPTRCGACWRSRARAPADVERFIHGTTVATNAVLEQKGAVTAVLTTEGFEDVLELGRQKRSRMYDLDMDAGDADVPRARAGAAWASASGSTRAAAC